MSATPQQLVWRPWDLLQHSQGLLYLHIHREGSWLGLPKLLGSTVYNLITLQNCTWREFLEAKLATDWGLNKFSISPLDRMLFSAALWGAYCGKASATLPFFSSCKCQGQKYCGCYSHSAMQCRASLRLGTGEVAVVQIGLGGPCLRREAACQDLCHPTTRPCCSRTRNPEVVDRGWIVLHVGAES